MKVIRGLLGVVVAAAAFYLLIGFLGQFPAVRRYPWIFEIWSSLRPLAKAVAIQLPSAYNRVDFALLWPLAGIVLGYAGALSLLKHADNAVRRMRVLRELSAPRNPAPAAAPSSPASPTAKVDLRTPHASAAPGPVHVPDGSRVYISEFLMVLDLVDSTRIVTRFGNALLATMKSQLERIVVPVCSRHGATWIKGTGDGYLVTFAAMTPGLAALREIFNALGPMNEGLPEGAELALRASVNFGEVIVERDSDRTGGAVHKTFRLQSVGSADLIEADGGIRREGFPLKNYAIASEEAQSGLHHDPAIECDFLGLCELKGFPGLHRVYRLRWQVEPREKVIEVVPISAATSAGAGAGPQAASASDK